ncbi:MAG: hypothetical protein R3C11_11145 [Planctomycetaceae bacterium]
MPPTYEMSVTATSLFGEDHWINGFLIFDYKNENDFKYAGFFANHNEWTIGHFQGNFSNRLARVNWETLGKTIEPDQAYQMHLRVDGNQVTLSVENQLVTTVTFSGGIGNGEAGVASYNAITRFDDFEIAESIPTPVERSFPFSENFEDGLADGFIEKPNSGWAIVNTPESYVLQTDNSTNMNLSLIHVPLENNIPSSFEMSARIKSHYSDSGWRNGFIIFDYKNDNDFKYAGFFTGQNEWIIGHYQGGFHDRLATVDWDNQGRKITPDTFYTLHVRIEFYKVWLSVDGEFIAFASFVSSVNAPNVGLAAARAYTSFDDFQVAERVKAGAPVDLPISENYDDGVANQFAFHNLNFWSIAGPASDRYLQIDASPNKGLGVSYFRNQFPLPQKYEVTSAVTSVSGDQNWLDGFIVFDYHSPTDFKYAGMFARQNQWVIGHYQGDWSNRIAQVDWDDTGQSIDLDTEIQFHVFVDGRNVTLRANGVEVVSGTFANGIGGGTVGVAAQNAVTYFDDFNVFVDQQKGDAFPLPYSEDFEDGTAEDFLIKGNSAEWAIVDNGNGKFLRVNSADVGGNTVGYLPIENPDGDSIRISADIRSDASTSWSDGFIIFDYKNENDFKYAGFFTGQNEWIIGHYLGNYNQLRLATVDWDSVGRKINFGQFYHLEVLLEGEIASLSVDGEVITEADFNTNITKGPVGLAAANAYTRFDNFQVDFLPQMVPTSDSLFANWSEESEPLFN